jgi:putative thioredoxin
MDALGGLADVLFEDGDRAAVDELLASIPEDKKDTPAIAGVRAKIALADQAAALGDPAALERRLAADPKDHEARFDLAMIQNALGKRNEAADNLLAIVKADRTWRDDGARAQLLQLFEAWGMTDEATLAARRKLSSLLFS